MQMVTLTSSSHVGDDDCSGRFFRSVVRISLHVQSPEEHYSNLNIWTLHIRMDAIDDKVEVEVEVEAGADIFWLLVGADIV